ncbi:hypothetical protein NQ317_013621 [Molorchus minor]|uniref:Uncharacterized protein n=1 Tax=Molorchus minor TaxID=1323400 RepID=A0ABQ9JRA9_9CUCU|nr:hypothetical protein NQ317_013621 [Molorchus minor]
MSMINENSMDMIHQSSMMSHVNENSNISVGNEDSLDVMAHRNSINRPSMNGEESVDIMIRRNSMSRSMSVCEASVDCSNASITAINGDTSSSLMNSNSSVGSDRPTMSQQIHSPLIPPNVNNVMLNSQSNLMVPPIINTRMPSPILGQPEMTNPHASPNISPDVILNSQISPSMMCRSTNNLQQESLLPATNLNMCQSTTSVESNLLPATISSGQPSLNAQSSPESMNSLHSPLSVSLVAESEKAVLFKAAADLLETQKKICELGTTLPSATAKCDIISMTSNTSQVMSNNNLSQLQGNTGNNFVQTQFNNLILSKSQDQKSDFVIPLPVKEIISTQSDKKNDDRMIPQSFTIIIGGGIMLMFRTYL